MSTSRNKGMRENAKVMQSNIFYHPEYRDVFVTLLRNFSEVLQTKTFLCTVVETAHIFIRLMERYCRENKHMVVREKRKSKKSNKSKKGGKGRQPTVLTEDQLIDLWETIDAR